MVFFGVGGIGMGREGTAVHGVRIVFNSMSVLQTDLISILYKQSLQWWFRCRRLKECVGSVCVGGTTDGNVHGWVRSERYVPNIYGTYTHKYIGHKITNWWGCGGRRSEHCRRCVPRLDHTDFL